MARWHNRRQPQLVAVVANTKLSSPPEHFDTPASHEAMRAIGRGSAPRHRLGFTDTVAVRPGNSAPRWRTVLGDHGRKWEIISSLVILRTAYGDRQAWWLEATISGPRARHKGPRTRSSSGRSPTSATGVAVLDDPRKADWSSSSVRPEPGALADVSPRPQPRCALGQRRPGRPPRPSRRARRRRVPDR